MVVHISTGHHSGTLVNALLHHCGLPGILIDQIASGRQPGAGSQSEQHVQARCDATDLEKLTAQNESECFGIEDEDEEEEMGDPPLLKSLPGSAPQSGGVLRPGL